MRKIAFLILPECSNFGVAAATEPLFVANWLAQRQIFDWQLLSTDGKPVRASNGRCIAVDGGLDNAAGCKSLFVLASFVPDDAARQREIVRWLRRQAKFGVELCGLENGSLVLAASGLLNGHTVAVHWDNVSGFQEQFPRTRVVDHLYARSGDRITCAGAAATLDLMVSWIGWHADAELASEVADHLLLGRPRSGEVVQRSAATADLAATDSAVTRARALMMQHIEEPLTCGDLARRVDLSLRQIERRFQEALGCSVLQQYRQIRMTRAHQLLQQTDLAVTEVAFACGFASPEYFCRLYRTLFGCSPSSDRRQSTTAPVLRRQASLRRKAG